MNINSSEIPNAIVWKDNIDEGTTCELDEIGELKEVLHMQSLAERFWHADNILWPAQKLPAVFGARKLH